MQGKKHIVTSETEATVKALASFGTPHEKIAIYIGLKDVNALKKHYGSILRTAETAANGQVAKRLFQSAVEEGNVAAMIFWLKTRARWSEKIETEQSGEVRIRVIRDDPDTE